MTKNTATISLPGGLWHKGKRYQEVVICALSGNDQEYLKDDYQILTQAEWSTLLLTRCIKRIGPFDTITSDLVKALTIGDREAALLQIRHLTFGNKLNCFINCTNGNCNGQIGLDLKVSDLLVSPYQVVQERYRQTITHNGEKYIVDFRLPTGLDQEKIGRIAKKNQEISTLQVFQSCISRIEINGKGKSKKIPLKVYDKVFKSVDQLDPQAEIRFKITCPECNNDFTTIFDTGIYIRNELDNSLNELYNEIHFLALHYHWSEQEIMDMSIGKRRLYRDLLLNAISEEVLE
jgi:hypothetical protein